MAKNRNYSGRSRIPASGVVVALGALVAIALLINVNRTTPETPARDADSVETEVPSGAENSSDYGRESEGLDESGSSTVAVNDSTARPTHDLYEALYPNQIEKPCTPMTIAMTDGNGNISEVVSCKSHEPDAVDEYDGYSNAALIELSYNDPKAARKVGARLLETDLETAQQLLFRASALSGGDPEPILFLANTTYSRVDRVSHLSEAYVLQSVSGVLGSRAIDTDWYVRRLQEFGLGSDDFEQLDAQVQSRLVEMAKIEETAANSRHIRELIK